MRPSSRRPRITESQYFDYRRDTKRWSCNICTGWCNDMTTHAAVKHEQTAEHIENVHSRQEWNLRPPDDVDAWVNPADDHIDQLRDYIPFWRRTIEAAECGETLRFEDFIKALTKKPESKARWDLEEVPGWGTVSSDPPEQKSHTRRSESIPERDREGFDFVERIARMNSADAERKKRLHSFYNIPINEKVQRLNELIDALRKMGQRAAP